MAWCHHDITLNKAEQADINSRMQKATIIEYQIYD